MNFVRLLGRLTFSIFGFLSCFLECESATFRGTIKSDKWIKCSTKSASDRLIRDLSLIHI